MSVELENKIKALEDKLSFVLEAFKESNELQKNNADAIDTNFQIINKKIDLLHADTNLNFDEVKQELVKIQKATSYNELFNNVPKN